MKVNFKNSNLKLLRNLFLCFLLIIPSFSSTLCACFDNQFSASKKEDHACCHQASLEKVEIYNTQASFQAPQFCHCMSEQNHFEAEESSKYIPLQNIHSDTYKLLPLLAPLYPSLEISKLQAHRIPLIPPEFLMFKNTTLYRDNQSFLI